MSNLTSGYVFKSLTRKVAAKLQLASTNFCGVYILSKFEVKVLYLEEFVSFYGERFHL